MRLDHFINNLGDRNPFLHPDICICPVQSPQHGAFSVFPAISVKSGEIDFRSIISPMLSYGGTIVRSFFTDGLLSDHHDVPVGPTNNIF